MYAHAWASRTLHLPFCRTLAPTGRAIWRGTLDSRGRTQQTGWNLHGSAAPYLSVGLGQGHRHRCAATLHAQAGPETPNEAAFGWRAEARRDGSRARSTDELCSDAGRICMAPPNAHLGHPSRTRGEELVERPPCAGAKTLRSLPSHRASRGTILHTDQISVKVEMISA